MYLSLTKYIKSNEIFLLIKVYSWFYPLFYNFNRVTYSWSECKLLEEKTLVYS